MLLMGSTSLVGLMVYLSTVTFPIALQAANIVLWSTWAGKPLSMHGIGDAGSLEATKHRWAGTRRQPGMPIAVRDAYRISPMNES